MGRRHSAALPRQGRTGLNLPLTITVLTPLTLGRPAVAGRLPLGALAPEVDRLGSFRGDAVGTSSARLGSGEVAGVAPLPASHCRCCGRISHRARAHCRPGPDAQSAISELGRARRVDERHCPVGHSRPQFRAAAAAAAGHTGQLVSPPGQHEA